ncbi:MAG TPA: dienelactone hydrolase family protein, partial [Longimicrobiales bacterium]
RRGAGLSQDQGSRPGNAMDSALARGGQAARNRLQMEMLESEQVPDALAGIAYLRGRPDVDARRLAVIGHSFGGSVTLLVAERDSALKAAVSFSGAAASWARSPELRARLHAAVRTTTVPILFIHTANDYGVESGPALAAEMKRLGKTAQLKIYPAYGSTSREGHNFLFLDPSIWERDVFAFLDRYDSR